MACSEVEALTKHRDDLGAALDRMRIDVATARSILLRGAAAGHPTDLVAIARMEHLRRALAEACVLASADPRNLDDANAERARARILELERHAAPTLDQDREERLQRLARYIVDFFSDRNGGELAEHFDDMRHADFDLLLEQLALILKHGGKPPNWVT